MSDEVQSLAVQEQESGTPVPKQPLGPVIEGLTHRQQKAVALIGEGQSIKVVGQTIGADPGTVYRWIRSDAHFRAAYNACQLEQRESCRAALLKCAERAVTRITRGVDIDPDLAFKVVKEMGLLRRRRLPVRPEEDRAQARNCRVNRPGAV